MNQAFKEYVGKQMKKEQPSIRRTLAILTDDPFPNMERTPVDYEELDEKVEKANRIEPSEIKQENSFYTISFL